MGKWGTRKAFNQNSLMQLFNEDRRIVHWLSNFFHFGETLKNTLYNRTLV